MFLPGEFHGQRSVVGYSPWGHKESNTTEWLTVWCFWGLSFFFFFWGLSLLHHVSVLHFHIVCFIDYMVILIIWNFIVSAYLFTCSLSILNGTHSHSRSPFIWCKQISCPTVSEQVKWKIWQITYPCGGFRQIRAGSDENPCLPPPLLYLGTKT